MAGLALIIVLSSKFGMIALIFGMLEGLSTLHEMNRAHTGTMWDSRGETTEFY